MKRRKHRDRQAIHIQHVIVGYGDAGGTRCCDDAETNVLLANRSSGNQKPSGAVGAVGSVPLVELVKAAVRRTADRGFAVRHQSLCPPMALLEMGHVQHVVGFDDVPRSPSAVNKRLREAC